jgi:hypothetical protein
VLRLKIRFNRQPNRHRGRVDVSPAFVGARSAGGWTAPDVGDDATTGAADVGNATSLGGAAKVAVGAANPAVGAANPAVGAAAATGDASPAMGDADATGDACGETIVGDACGEIAAGDDPTAMGDGCTTTADGDAFGAIALGEAFGADTGDALGATTVVSCGCGAMAAGATGGKTPPGKGRRTVRAPFPCANLIGLPL